MQVICRNDWCKQSFEITDDDLAFYDKVSPEFGGKKFLIPPPTLCPDCRTRRRLSHVNRSHLYRRVSSFSGKEIISIFSPDKPLKVYENEVWWSDQWDPFDYGREPELSKPILSQLGRLFSEVPVMALFNEANENSPYVNTTGWAKNCYLCYGADYSQDCYYGEAIYYCKDTMDCLYGQRLERCYECIDCDDCFSLLFGHNCNQCSDSAFLHNCIGCQSCFGCSGLRHKKHCYLNEQLTPEQCRLKIARHFPLTSSIVAESKAKLRELALKLPQKSLVGIGNENVSGNYLSRSKNAFWCFDSDELQDCKYCTNTRTAKDCRDINYWGHPGELLYENMAAGEGAQMVIFSNCVWGGTNNLYYCTYCIGCKHCFGCSGLRHKSCCVFNKQYSKQQYESLVPSIIEHMKATPLRLPDGSFAGQEWGEFLPAPLSPFGYNETLAQEYFPMTRDGVLERGWKWSDFEAPAPETKKLISAVQLPQSIDTVPDNLLHWAIECEATKRPFNIIKQELDFYRQMQLPIPRLHPDERHRRRMALRNPRKLWNRTCAKCQKPITTSYAPDRPEIVYCESCYLATVY